MIKLVEVNLDDGRQSFFDERHEFRQLAEDVYNFKTKMLKTLGAGIMLKDIVELEKKVYWLIQHLNDLCESVRSVEDMFETLKKKAITKGGQTVQNT